jgi:hypothetical protein
MEKLEEIGEEAIHCLFTYAGDGLFEVEQKKKKKNKKKKKKKKQYVVDLRKRTCRCKK